MGDAPRTRISEDVIAIAKQVAAVHGFPSYRVAIESIVRVYADHYMQISFPDGTRSQPSKTAEMNAVDAFNALLSQ